MKNLVSIVVVLFSLFNEGEMGRFSPPPSAVATECGKLVNMTEIIHSSW